MCHCAFSYPIHICLCLSYYARIKYNHLIENLKKKKEHVMDIILDQAAQDGRTVEKILEVLDEKYSDNCI